MPWFWGAGNEQEEYSEDEYDSEELSSVEYEADDHADDEGKMEDDGEDDSQDSHEYERKERSSEIAEDNVVAEQKGADDAAAPATSPASEIAVDTDLQTSGPVVVEEEEVDPAVTNRNLGPELGDEMDSEVEDQVLLGHLPGSVEVEESELSRARLDSGITFGDEDDAKNITDNADLDSDDSMEEDDKEQLAEQEQEKPEENDYVTSTAEKQSLLALAAEHDRVDILQAILTDVNSGDGTLLNGADNSCIPPLHIAVSFGSINATNCLLRMGADPSVRPNVEAILEASAGNKDNAPVQVAHIQRYNGATVWELVFGTASDGEEPSSRWSFFSGSPAADSSEKVEGRKKIKPVDIPLSKREGIRHAFTAEALRSIGSDEVARLHQLLLAGMPDNIEIGGKQLYDWAVEMGALQCEELLRPTQLKDGQTGNSGAAEAGKDSAAAENDNPSKTRNSVVLDRGQPGGPQTIPKLLNRLDELESLAKALSACLDNLGEEVAVCSGLLLMGSGASALASHVRSLRTTKLNKEEELSRLQEAWENSEDELAYWVRKCGPEGEKIAAQITVPVSSRSRQAAGEEDEASQQRQLLAQVAASENKIRMLRVSIADLSDENARNLAEVERRGLSGGITLVRGLREEIRDVEYQISQAKSGDAECRMKISMLQSKYKPNPPKNGSSSENNSTPQEVRITMQSEEKNDPVQSAGLPSFDESTRKGSAHGLSTEEERTISRDKKTGGSPNNFIPGHVMKPSERIASGQSTALVVRGEGNRGFFPLSLWQILMRIIGLVDEVPTRRQNRQNIRAPPAVII